MNFELGEECIQFRELVMEINSTESVLTTPQHFMTFLRSKKIVATYPNLENCLRIYLTILSANTTGERSFSRLKLIKTCLRNSISQENLNSEAIICLNNDLLHKVDKNKIIDEFATLKARKMCIKL